MNLMLPGTPRYQPKQLIPYFGYDNLFRTLGEVELALLDVLAELGVMSAETYALLTPEKRQTVLAITTTEVEEVERKQTKHDIRAWILFACAILGEDLARWVHVLLTSYDPVDTARSLQYLRAYRGALKPSLKDFISIMAERVRSFAHTLQIGRTHGQHALPITVGFWLATILNRVLYNQQKMEKHSLELVGKISGAVGAKNAQVGLGVEALCGDRSFETRVLDKLGLTPPLISTQILPPEPLAYFLFSSSLMSASLAQFGRDCRHLMRSEIAEIGEPFSADQAGSSTMAQKRNPINFENTEGMWIKTKNEFGKVLDTLISEHQRDLVGSCVARDFPIILVNLQQQLNTLLRKDGKGQAFLSRITVDERNCKANFERSAHLILAEPLYIALQMAGYRGDAHHFVNHTLVPKAQQTGQLLVEVLEEVAVPDSNEWLAMRAIPKEVFTLLHQPKNYTGSAAEQALNVASLAQAVARSM